MAENNETPARVFMVCENEEVGKDAGELFKRVAAALAAVNVYFDRACATDDDATELELCKELAPALERLTLTLMALYPNAGQFDADIKSIGDFTTRIIPSRASHDID